MTRERAIVVCPGRGTYNQAEWGYLSKHHADRVELLDAFDAYRRQKGQPGLRALDHEIPYQLALHSRGDHASALIYACALLDAQAIDCERYEIVAVTGNSMGWYIALAVAQALAPMDALHLVDTMGTLMHESLIGGQLLQPFVGEDWRPDAAERDRLLALMEDARAAGVVHRSIELGGMLVFGGDEPGLARLSELLPGRDRYPMRLHNHAAFHTPLQAPVRERARRTLSAEPFRAPAVPMVDGRGAIWTPHATDRAALWDYTLGHQLVEPYDFTRALGVAVREFAPDRIIVLGPGSTLTGAVAQTLIALDWRGLADKAAFQARQQADPPVLAMGWEAQRARVITQ